MAGIRGEGRPVVRHNNAVFIGHLAGIQHIGGPAVSNEAQCKGHGFHHGHRQAAEILVKGIRVDGINDGILHLEMAFPATPDRRADGALHMDSGILHGHIRVAGGHNPCAIALEVVSAMAHKGEVRPLNGIFAAGHHDTVEQMLMIVDL